jgi:hypothetical protein
LRYFHRNGGKTAANRKGAPGNILSARSQGNQAARYRGESIHLLGPQSQLLPQLHSLPSFMGQFLPVFLQLGFSAAKAEVQIIAARIDMSTFIDVFMALIFSGSGFLASKFSTCND